MAEQPKVLAAIVFCALDAPAFVVLALAPQAEDAGWGRTVGRGALFGLFACATRDLSNLATLRTWPFRFLKEAVENDGRPASRATRCVGCQTIRSANSNTHRTLGSVARHGPALRRLPPAPKLRRDTAELCRPVARAARLPNSLKLLAGNTPNTPSNRAATCSRWHAGSAFLA
jgi:hypothetical protein